MMHAASMQKKLSPRLAATQKKGASPKISSSQKKRALSPKGDRCRASWNAGLEKALVELLRDHNHPFYKGQNGWTTEAWNRIVKEFHNKFPYVSFSKVQIQDKEKELNRDYKTLKEARKQSGVSWDERLCMIEAEPPIWQNIIQSFPKARKFQIKLFPLFDSLGELYDGQTADGTLNFTSVEPTQTKPSVTQVNDVEAQEAENGTSPNLHDDDDDDEVMILHQLDQGCASTSTMPTTSSSRRANPRDKEPAAPRDKVRKVGQKCKRNADVADMMGEYLALKTKQAEEEAAEQERARTKADADDFPITMCIAVVDQMEELSDEEKVDAYDIFKDAQNRAIFMTAKPSTGLLWLRKKIMSVSADSSPQDGG